MLSAIILCDASASAAMRPEALVRTLAPLVGACVAGLVQDVVLAGPGDAELAAVADHAGCALVEGSREADWLAGAVAHARRPLLLVLRAGFAPEAGFVEEIEDLAALLPTTALLMRATPQSGVARLIPQLAPVAGLVMPAARCVGAPGFAGLVRTAGPTRQLRSRARPVV
jgi:hypothetical protein